MDAADLRKTLRALGVHTRADLLAAGIPAARIDTAVRNGKLILLSRGVYARSTVAKKVQVKAGGQYLIQVAGALAAAGNDIAVSHQSAARLYGIALLGKPGPSVTLTGPPQHTRHSRGGVHLYSAALPPDHLATRSGLPATTPARTVVDLARTLDFKGGVVAADSALYKKLTTKADLRAVMATLPRRPGMARAAEVIEFADARSESPLESIARVQFTSSNLPPPELQIQLGNDFEPIARVDFYWKDFRTAAEADGALKYDEDPARARRQLRRDALLRAEGYEIVHFTWQDINFSPGLVATWIRNAFRRQIEAGHAPGGQRAG